MAASSQVNQNKRRRDEYWNGGLALPEVKRTNNRTMGRDSDIIALLDIIDNMDGNDSNPEETEVGIINSLEDEVRLKAQTDHNIESTDDKGSADRMGSIKQRQLTAEEIIEANSVIPDIGDFTYYDDLGSELGFSVELITPHELGIFLNHIDGDSMPHIMYSEVVYGYAQTTDVFHGSLWEDDIWHLDEQPFIQNDLESPEQEESGITSGVKFHDVLNDIITPIQRHVNGDEEGL